MHAHRYTQPSMYFSWASSAGLIKIKQSQWLKPSDNHCSDGCHRKCTMPSRLAMLSWRSRTEPGHFGAQHQGHQGHDEGYWRHKLGIYFPTCLGIPHGPPQLWFVKLFNRGICHQCGWPQWEIDKKYIKWMSIESQQHSLCSCQKLQLKHWTYQYHTRYEMGSCDSWPLHTFLPPCGWFQSPSGKPAIVRSGPIGQENLAVSCLMLFHLIQNNKTQCKKQEAGKCCWTQSK